MGQRLKNAVQRLREEQLLSKAELARRAEDEIRAAPPAQLPRR